MSEWFLPEPFDGADSRVPEPIEYVEPRRAEEEAREGWSLRAAGYRALELAELIFGEGVRAELGRGPRGHSFRGLLHLDVPFTTLTRHRDLERIFVAAAGRDPILRRTPLVFLFGALAD